MGNIVSLKAARQHNAVTRKQQNLTQECHRFEQEHGSCILSEMWPDLLNWCVDEYHPNYPDSYFNMFTHWDVLPWDGSVCLSLATGYPLTQFEQRGNVLVAQHQTDANVHPYCVIVEQSSTGKDFLEFLAKARPANQTFHQILVQYIASVSDETIHTPRERTHLPPEILLIMQWIERLQTQLQSNMVVCDVEVRDEILSVTLAGGQKRFVVDMDYLHLREEFQQYVGRINTDVGRINTDVAATIDTALPAANDA